VTRRRDLEHVVQKALACWAKARALDAQGRTVRATATYTKGFATFLSFLHRTDRSDLVPVYHAFGMISVEIAMRLDPAASGRTATEYARVALAASHFADPAAGEPPRIRNVLRDEAAEPLFQLVLGGGEQPPLRAATLIGGAAEARILLAELLRKYRSQPEPGGPRWPIGSGGKPTTYLQHQKRYRRAILPSCLSMDIDAEMRQLATEGVLMYDELCRSERGFESSCRRAVETLARIDGVTR
jgi:hypothetical protein